MRLYGPFGPCLRALLRKKSLRGPLRKRRRIGSIPAAKHGLNNAGKNAEPSSVGTGVVVVVVSQMQCPLCPRKRTCAVQLGMSALCQSGHWASARLADKLICLKKLLARFGYLKQAPKRTFGR